MKVLSRAIINPLHVCQTWKIFTGIISDQVHESQDDRRVLTEGHKGCKRGDRGANDLIFIDGPKGGKRRKKI